MTAQMAGQKRAFSRPKPNASASLPSSSGQEGNAPTTADAHDALCAAFVCRTWKARPPEEQPGAEAPNSCVLFRGPEGPRFHRCPRGLRRPPVRTFAGCHTDSEGLRFHRCPRGLRRPPVRTFAGCHTDSEGPRFHRSPRGLRQPPVQTFAGCHTDVKHLPCAELFRELGLVLRSLPSSGQALPMSG
jgi:hypothetical protein